MVATDIKKIMRNMLCAPQVCIYLCVFWFVFGFAFEHELSEHVHFVCMRVFKASVNALQSKMMHYNHG